MRKIIDMQWYNIDMNMVRAGVVKHPAEWLFCGYRFKTRVKGTH